MFNVGGGELMLIALVALLVLGPDKLPDFARKSARLVGQLRSMSQGFQNEMKSVIDVDEMKNLMNEGTGSLQGTKGPRLVGPIDEGKGPIDANASNATASSVGGETPSDPGAAASAPSTSDAGSPQPAAGTADGGEATQGDTSAA